MNVRSLPEPSSTRSSPANESTPSSPPNAWITSASGVPLSRLGPSSPSIVAATAVAVTAPAAASVATSWTARRLLHLGTGPTSWLYG